MSGKLKHLQMKRIDTRKVAYSKGGETVVNMKTFSEDVEAKLAEDDWKFDIQCVEICSGLDYDTCERLVNNTPEGNKIVEESRSLCGVGVKTDEDEEKQFTEDDQDAVDKGYYDPPTLGA